MCNLSEGVFEDGMKKGEKKAKLQSILDISETLNVPVEKAMDFLKIDVSERPFYLDLIQKKKGDD